MAVGALLPFRLSWRSPSASELMLLWGLEEMRLLGREYACQYREEQDLEQYVLQNLLLQCPLLQILTATSWFPRHFLLREETGEKQQAVILAGVKRGTWSQATEL